MSKETSEIKTYHGNCHCGSFKFNIQIPGLKIINECNCNMCHKKSHKWVFPAIQFTIEKGEGSLQVYKPAMCELTQKFCPTCGSTVMGVRYGASSIRDIAINARTLRNVDIWTLESQSFDSRSLELPYFHPKFTGSEPTPEIEGLKLYTGACHCGAVTLAVKAKPFPIKGQPVPEVSEYIQECKCSICIRNGTTFIYPHLSQVSIYNAPENLVTYMFGRKLQKHMFCRTCGISVCIEKTSPPKEVAVLWPDAKQEIWPMILPINLRILDCVEWD
ncbi:hypothetical protein OIDMADRAFT_78264, partial [Oidiodendron maius Zn]